MNIPECTSFAYFAFFESVYLSSPYRILGEVMRYIDFIHTVWVVLFTKLTLRQRPMNNSNISIRKKGEEGLTMTSHTECL